ncbi:glutathione synthetase-like protein [Algoriphagus ratkowskyi]|uniref:Glutathione synthetase n=1 Tax=Algoriphagus ratkowskyi TaxID=57028 RepID=A0A2W7R010_9BACT|nr:glutathione synthetase [Algoriphagus ratkowskyi]PZX53854.1 glutathione synthetase-like protein [Algoriphagus ratkowskyi]TXD76741.1 glutathione synthetase [Algoriphagus ratkowskyi]
MAQHIAIVSYFSKGAYDTNTTDENLILSTILHELGISHQIVAWSDSTVDWSSFSSLLIKSTWDYFDYYEEFKLWLATIRELGIPVLNSLDTLEWNSSKRYLLQIESKGFPVISGHILEKGTVISASAIFKKISSEILVVKPLVSGGAKNTLKIVKKDWGNYANQVQALVDEEAYLVQPFVNEVQEVGEYSLIFFNGEFSHAVLKTPANEDFRVQHYFGGTIKSVEPSLKMLDSCQKLMDNFGKDTLYARVDGVDCAGEFFLMELELIEPYLFLDISIEALANYKRAIATCLA